MKYKIKKSQKDLQIKFLKIDKTFLSILLFISIVLYLILASEVYPVTEIMYDVKTYFKTPKNVDLESQIGIKVNLSGLEYNEQLKVKEILSQVNPLYLKEQESIHFVKDIDRHWDEFGGNNSKYIDGFNFKRGTIYVKHKSFLKSEMKDTICHELLHSYFFPGKVSHEIIYDLAKKGVCYKK